jgi:hypothetical protein
MNKETFESMFPYYEYLQSVRLAGVVTVVALGKAPGSPYIVGDYSERNPLGIGEISNIANDADYLAAMRTFTERLGARLDDLALEQGDNPLEGVIKASDCVPGALDSDLAGKVAVIKAERLSPEYRAVKNQLVLVTGGFGARPDASGRAVYCTSLHSGAQNRWDRGDIAGVMDEKTLPEWAKEKLAALRREEPERDSTLAKLRAAKSAPRNVKQTQGKKEMER